MDWQVSSPGRLERKEKKEACKERGGAFPVISLASGELVVTLVSVPQKKS